MFKKSGPGQAETDEKTMKPLIRNYFGEMLEKHRIKEATENLKALKLSEDDLVIIKGNKALVIPEKALKQVEEFGRMSLGLEKGVAHELDTKAVGEFINKNICVVKEFILPKEDRILAIRKDSARRIPNGFIVPTEEGFKRVDMWSSDTWMNASEFLARVDDMNAWVEPKLRETFQWISGELARFEHVDKIITGHWEELSTTHSTLALKEYGGRVRGTRGSKVCDLHIHPEEDNKWHGTTTSDITANTRLDESGWLAILHVRDGTNPEDFKFSKEMLSISYLPKGNKWAEKADHEGLSKSLKELGLTLKDKDRGLPEVGLSEFDKFERKQGAVIRTYGELLEMTSKWK